ncbi:type IV pilus modification PilV family protein [Natranaerobius trueperi]|uniref:Prepilin-type cleavage/methylation domain-containing protein n=1 Tax=Natranaerobius trueperi TaxID=759412 RepID=A0A226C102_9FIRM|nr:prepilin-type N-terminal cleavage/methylation domain-containing protein [Natranaerobius trueperi]OWZ84050.1 hypothetical protein CDO51_05685 [Natranaerobius trueperi]
MAQLNSEAGYTLLEVLGSVVILGLIVTPLLGILGQGLIRVNEGEDYTKAVQLAQGKMEYLMINSSEELISYDSIKYEEDIFEVTISVEHYSENLLLVGLIVNWNEMERDYLYQLKAYRFIV